jgi:alpha/beta superfamily hydrolase
MKHIAYLHGLNSTHASFSYIVQQLPAHHHHFIDYTSQQNLDASIEECAVKLFASLPRNASVTLIGHSLGGVIAAIIAADFPHRIENLITISAPLNGSRAAIALRWIPGISPVLHDITPSGVIINRCGDLDLSMPTLSIISTGGHTATFDAAQEQNDSVVALASQKGLRFGKKVEIDANHFEVLLSHQTATEIRSFIFGEQNEDQHSTRNTA